jgi:hypothetical protein
VIIVPVLVVIVRSPLGVVPCDTVALVSFVLAAVAIFGSTAAAVTVAPATKKSRRVEWVLVSFIFRSLSGGVA